MSFGQLPPVPSLVTGPLYIYLTQIRDRINSLPHVSYFSGTNPNGNVANGSAITGLPGLSLAVNLGSASTTSRWWVMGGVGSQLTQNGWAVIRVLA